MGRVEQIYRDVTEQADEAPVDVRSSVWNSTRY